ncbi:MAG: hypothetical protein Q8R78_06550 [Candidatus Omnitrophota bacterium]|nr:hypothetical protein [Candidatus Omnitrophota bacterium]
MMHSARWPEFTTLRSGRARPGGLWIIESNCTEPERLEEFNVLALYETDGDPLEAVSTFSRDHRPRLKAAGRLSDIIDVTYRGSFSTMETNR